MSPKSRLSIVLLVLLAILVGVSAFTFEYALHSDIGACVEVKVWGEPFEPTWRTIPRSELLKPEWKASLDDVSLPNWSFLASRIEDMLAVDTKNRFGRLVGAGVSARVQGLCLSGQASFLVESESAYGTTIKFQDVYDTEAGTLQLKVSIFPVSGDGEMFTVSYCVSPE
jgi:hypothetical protein